MSRQPRLEASVEGAQLLVTLAGDWHLEGLGTVQPGWPTDLAQSTAGPTTLAYRNLGLGSWDSHLLIELRRLEGHARAAGLTIDRTGLPSGVRDLLVLAEAVPPGAARAAPPGGGLVAGLGRATLAAMGALTDAVRFVGEVALAVVTVLRRQARFRGIDFARELEATGVRALPIVGLIAMLVGMILAFIGAIQLAQFGAEIYVANLVAVGMLREMGAMMAAIIMAGRTGAAFAAEIGTMQVNEEVDALTTTGLDPMAFLVLPRLLALLLMLPLLAVYADLLGIIGGAIIGTGVLEIRPALYLDQTLRFVGPNDVAAGLVKAVCFACVVALAGCYHGVRCGRSSAAVGRATTAAVVTGIVGIVVVDAMLTLVFHALGV